MSNLTGQSIVSGLYSGLSSTYSYLAKLNPDGVTLESINKARTDSSTSNLINQSFASYMTNNFSSLDKDSDGVIGADELQDFGNKISTQGVTRQDLTQLLTSGAMSADTIQQILEHFDEMDTNHDGRVTPGEISAYSVNGAKQEKADEYAHQKATNMSVFYGDDSSSSADSYSMLSYRYKNNKS